MSVGIIGSHGNNSVIMRIAALFFIVDKIKKVFSVSQRQYEYFEFRNMFNF